MLCILKPHPDTPSPAVTRLTVEVERATPAVLRLRYVVEGDLERVAWPAPAAAEPTDGLWRHTCFEAFVRGPGEGYREFNFAPSGAWAAYDFDAYRAGMRPARIDAPDIAWDGTALTATASLPPGASRLSLTAVIEGSDGRISYWALAHPPGKPDFHHADCFAAELPAPDRA
jgi:hypothetical protein